MCVREARLRKKAIAEIELLVFDYDKINNIKQQYGNLATNEYNQNNQSGLTAFGH